MGAPVLGAGVPYSFVGAIVWRIRALFGSTCGIPIRRFDSYPPLFCHGQ